MFSYYNEKAESNILSSVSATVDKQVLVLRGGQESRVRSSAIVNGDIIHLCRDDIVPADIVLLRPGGSENSDGFVSRSQPEQLLLVDCSWLYGNAEPVVRGIGCSDQDPLKTRNILFQGSKVLSGSAMGIVIRTGDSTVISRIAQLSAKNLFTDLTDKGGRKWTIFLRINTAFSILLGLICMFLAIFLQKRSFAESLVFFVGVVVACIPEGFLPVMTLSLLTTSRRLIRNNITVKRLESLKLLGAVSMVAFGSRSFSLPLCVKEVYIGELEAQDIEEEKGLSKDLMRAASLCNSASVKVDKIETDEKSRPRINVVGGPIDKCIMHFTHSFCNSVQFRELYPRIDGCSSDSKLRLQVSVNRQPDSDDLLLVLCGNAKLILEKCKFYRQSSTGNNVPINEEFMAKFTELVEQHSGKKIVAYCERILPSDKFKPTFKFDFSKINFPASEMTFVGCFVLSEDRSDEICSTIQAFKRHKLTLAYFSEEDPEFALATARQLNFVSKENVTIFEAGSGAESKTKNAVLVDARQSLSRTDWKSIVAHKVIVVGNARNKSTLVEQAQMYGLHSVAAFGHNIADAPALREAAIGVSYRSSSELSQDVADVILMDSNPASLLKAIQQSRILSMNWSNAAMFMVASNMPQLAPMILTSIAGVPVALTAVLSLVIDLGTDLYPAMSLLHEQIFETKSLVPSRNSKEKVEGKRWQMLASVLWAYLVPGVIETACGFTMFFVALSRRGIQFTALFNSYARFYDRRAIMWKTTYSYRMESLEIAQAAYFAGVVVCQLFWLLCSKSRTRSVLISNIFKNWNMVLSIFVSVFVFVLVVFVPKMDILFGTARVPLDVLWICLPFAACILMVEELRKLVLQSRRK